MGIPPVIFIQLRHGEVYGAEAASEDLTLKNSLCQCAAGPPGFFRAKLRKKTFNLEEGLEGLPDQGSNQGPRSTVSGNDRFTTSQQ